MTLLFSEPDHRYYWDEQPDVKLTSVSTLIGMYHEKFDSELRSKKYAEKHNMSQEEVLQMWEDKKVKSQIKGTLYHKKKEDELLSKQGVFRHPEVEGVKQALDITELKPGIYPELIVYHPKYNIVGTADYVEIFPDNSFILKDWKTSKKLDFEGFPVWNPKTYRREPKKMFAPLNHLSDCNGTHYTLQLSIYSYLLEEAGYECKEIILEHVQFDEDKEVMVVEYPINYLKKEVKNLCEHFKSKR